MKYTREQLENMSDDRLRVIIQELFGAVFDDANQILPIAGKYEINIGPLGDGEWYALRHDLGKGILITTEYHDKSVCRAIACCLLMMEIGK